MTARDPARGARLQARGNSRDTPELRRQSGDLAAGVSVLPATSTHRAAGRRKKALGATPLRSPAALELRDPVLHDRDAGLSGLHRARDNEALAIGSVVGPDPCRPLLALEQPLRRADLQLRCGAYRAPP